jgi:hypothetical protein
MDVARVSSGKIKLVREPVALQLVVDRARDQVEPRFRRGAASWRSGAEQNRSMSKATWCA